MDPRSKAVLDAALALPDEERSLVVHELLSSLSPEWDERSEDEFVAELDRRRDEAIRDPSATVAWSELKGRD